MGYDMRWRRRDEEEFHNIKIARKAYREACNILDSLPAEERGTYIVDKVAEFGFEDPRSWEGRSERYTVAAQRNHKLMNAMYDVEASYFRLNIWGMRTWREVMYISGMAFEDDPHPPWPRFEDFGLTNEQHSAVEYPEDYPSVIITDDIRAAAERFKAANDRIRSWHGKADTPGIPLTKFSTNDGWIVLPIECEAAVRLWNAFVEEQGADAVDAFLTAANVDSNYWKSWLTYLTGAVTHDGFEVWL